MARSSSRNIDMLNGSIADKILAFALPLALTGMLQQLFNAADVAVVGQFAGKTAMAAVGSNTPVIGLLINAFIGVAIGANVVISRFTGEGNKAGIEKGVHTAFLFAILSGLTITIIGQSIASPLLHLLGVPAEVLPQSVLYLRIYLCGAPVIFLYNFESAIFRSQGDTRTPLICLTISGAVNVVLNIFFVVVLHMKAEGVALATVLSNLLCAGMLFVMLLRRTDSIKLDLRKISLDLQVLKEIIRIGFPAALQSMVFSISNLCIQSAVNSLGADVMAASAAAFNVEILAYYLVNSFGQAATTFIGQNHGAGNMERCRQVTSRCMLIGEIASLAVAGTIIFFGKPALALFNSDPIIVSYGIVRLRLILGGEFFNVIMEVLSGAMRGYGHSLLPAIQTLIGVCGVRIIWVYTVFKASPTFFSLMSVYPISWIITAIALTIAYFLLMRKLAR